MTELMAQALQEAYAVAPADVDVLDTIEFRHPALVDESENPDPLRLVRDHRNWELELEAGAPLHGGQTVTFARLGFDVDLPDSTEAVPSARLWLSAVSRKAIEAAERIIAVRAPIEVTYRAYLVPAEGDPVPEPSWVVDGLKLRNATADLQRMSGLLTFDLLGHRAFPFLKYTRKYFPGLGR